MLSMPMLVQETLACLSSQVFAAIRTLLRKVAQLLVCHRYPHHSMWIANAIVFQCLALSTPPR